MNSPPFNLLEQPESDNRKPVNHRHPRAPSLGIAHETIVSLSGCITRASILTASGAIATWMDDVMCGLFHSASSSTAAASAATAAAARLEHPATHFNELKSETVVRITTAPLITVVQCSSGAVYWWGVLPSYIRQRNLEKQKQLPSTNTGSAATQNAPGRQRQTSGGSIEANSKTASSASNAGSASSTASTQLLAPGDLVCMRNAPVFHSGAIGFTLVNGVPKVGVLLEDAWKLTDVRRFRVKCASSLGGTIPTKTCGVVPTAVSVTDHAATCPYAQAAAAAAAAAAQTEHEPQIAMDSATLEMPPPPSPASSTCSDHSGPVKVSPGPFSKSFIRSRDPKFIQGCISSYKRSVCEGHLNASA